MNVYLYVAGPKKMRTVLYYLYQMAGAVIRKLFMSSASSAIGTGTVLGIHGAMAPAAPSIQGSDIRDAKVDDSKNLMKFDLDGGSSFFMIVLMILIFLVVIVVIVVMPMYCCGCSPYKLRQKRKEEKWKWEFRQMMEQRNRLDAEAVEGGQLLGRGPTEL